MKRSHTIHSVVFAVSLLAGFGVAASEAPAPEGVYEYVVRNLSVDFDSAASALDAAFERSDFERITGLESSSPDDCSYRAKVFVLWNTDYTAKLRLAGPSTYPFAVTQRVNLFEDEDGIHVSIVNPANINRTILMNDQDYVALSDSIRTSLREMIQQAVDGEPSDVAYGPIRKKGYIGKTMGVMAGGPFDGKLQEIAELQGADFDAVIEQLRTGFGDADGKWGLAHAYSVVVAPGELAVIGLTGGPVESKSFSIVKNGQDRARSKFECPGIAHAAAYPLEIVVVRDGDTIRVQSVEAMYRMKMYFEDAGKWAFMKNMGMPGSIRDEIVEKVQSAISG